jgi:hypothetical protein
MNDRKMLDILTGCMTVDTPSKEETEGDPEEEKKGGI